MKYKNVLELKVGEALEELKRLERAIRVYEYLTQTLDFREFKAYEIASHDYKIKELLKLNVLNESEKSEFIKLL